MGRHIRKSQVTTFQKRKRSTKKYDIANSWTTHLQKKLNKKKK
jgi:hypothetical protein